MFTKPPLRVMDVARKSSAGTVTHLPPALISIVFTAIELSPLPLSTLRNTINQERMSQNLLTCLSEAVATPGLCLTPRHHAESNVGHQPAAVVNQFDQTFYKYVLAEQGQHRPRQRVASHR